MIFVELAVTASRTYYVMNENDVNMGHAVERDDHKMKRVERIRPPI